MASRPHDEHEPRGEPPEGFFDDAEADANAGAVVTFPTKPDLDVAASLKATAKGAPRACAANVMTILQLDPRWRDVIAYDAFREEPVFLRQPPQRRTDAIAIAPSSAITEQDVTRTCAWILDVYGFDAGAAKVLEAIMAVAERRKHHPVRAYLDGLRWDGEPRLDDFFARYCAVPPSTYATGVSRLLFLPAVARVRRPGCKVDTIPIIEGPQGGQKSSMVRALAGDAFFADTPIPLDSKDAYQALRSVWLYELGELAAFKGRDATRIKSFASSAVDTYRPSYERRTRAVARQCVFIGTTNEREYLTDHTGARRFWPIRIGRIDLEAIRRDRDQLWAEADFRFGEGESWWPGPELARLGEGEQEARHESDSWEEPLRRWLESPVRVRMSRDGERDVERLDPSEGFTMADILTEGLGIPLDRQDPRAIARVSRILHRAQWVRGRQRRADDEPDKRERRWSPASANAPGCDVPATEDGDT